MSPARTQGPSRAGTMDRIELAERRYRDLVRNGSSPATGPTATGNSPSTDC
jgi:hypothetical protein